jgi:hypothetical protein
MLIIARFRCINLAFCCRQVVDLPTHSTIDRVGAVLSVVVVHKKDGVLSKRYQPYKVLLNSNVQPLMLGKTIVEGLGLINANFEPGMYQIMTSMGGLRKAWVLTK